MAATTWAKRGCAPARCGVAGPIADASNTAPTEVVRGQISKIAGVFAVPTAFVLAQVSVPAQRSDGPIQRSNWYLVGRGRL